MIQSAYRSFMLTLLVVLAGLLLTGSDNPDYSSGRNNHFQKLNTIVIANDTIIPFGDSMVISPGTTVLFTGHYSIHVQGKLIALGTETDSIVFTVADTTGFHDFHSNLGGWNGIRFEDTPVETDSSLFAYCRFEFGKAVGDSVNCYGGAIRLINFSRVRFSNSTFHKNYAFYWGGAIYAQKAHIIIEHCVFTDNYSGNDGLIYGYGGAVCFVSSNPDVYFCRFTGNTSTGIGGGISFEYSNPRMLNCIFDLNYSGLGGGIGFLRCAPDRGIANILVHHNSAQFFGGGIANVSASPQMSNLTIVSNYAAMGGGYYCNDYSDPKLYNSILWGNLSAGGSFGSQVWIWDVYSEPGFYHCNIEYGLPAFGGSMFIGQYINNIESNPQFTDWSDNNFKLTQDSPCINTGTPDTTGLLLPAFDLAMHARIIYSVIDMGVYEYDGPLGTAHNFDSVKSLSVYPNPVTAESQIVHKSNSNQPINIRIWDAQGRMRGESEISHSGNGDIRVGFYQLFPQLTGANGIFLLEFESDSRQEVIKVVISH